MRRGTCQQGGRRKGDWDSVGAGMADSTSAFQAAVSSEVLNRKRDQRRVTQTSSVERSSRCAQKTGKKHYRTVEQVLQDNKDLCLYEGQQKPAQVNMTGMSKKGEGMPGAQRNRGGHCPNGNFGNGVVVQMMETRCDQMPIGRNGANGQQSPPSGRGNSRKTTGSCNLAEHMSRNLTAPSMHGKCGPCSASPTRQRGAEQKVLNNGNQTLKVSNLETLVIQPGSPTVIEVRSSSSQTRKSPNPSCTHAPAMTSPSPCSPARPPTPSSPQQYAAPCGLDSETTDDDSLCDCAINETNPLTNQNGVTSNYKLRSASNTNNVVGPQRKESPSRISSSTANKELPPEMTDKSISNNKLLNNASQCATDEKTPVSGQQNNPSAGSQNTKPEKTRSSSNSKQTAVESTKIVSVKSDSLNQTLKVTNLDTVVIQPGSPTLIQVRSARSCPPKQVTSDAKEQECGQVVSQNVSAQGEKNTETKPIICDQQIENGETMTPRIEPCASEGASSPQAEEFCEWCEEENPGTGDAQYACNTDKSPREYTASPPREYTASPPREYTASPREYTASPQTSCPARVQQEERKRVCKEVDANTSMKQFGNKRWSRGANSECYQKGAMPYHHQSFQSGAHHKYDFPARPAYNLPPGYHAPARQYPPLPPANYQQPYAPHPDYPYVPVSRSSQNVAVQSGARYVEPYQPPPAPAHYYPQYPCTPQQYPMPQQQWAQPQMSHQYHQQHDDTSCAPYQTNDQGLGDGQQSNYGDQENEGGCIPGYEEYDNFYNQEHYDYCDAHAAYDEYQYAYNAEKLPNYDEYRGYACH